MRKMAWWGWLTLGLTVGGVAGSALTLVATRGTEVMNSAAWQEDVAWQGWVGSVFGAVVSVAVALFVLGKTLAHGREQFEGQLNSGRQQFERQLDWSRRQFAEQIATERELAFEQRRVEAWAALMTDLREFLFLPVALESVADLQSRASASYLRWRLYANESDEGVVDGVKRSIEKVIGPASAKARQARSDNEHIRPEDPIKSVRSDDATAELIVEIVKRGEALHTGPGARKDEARDWFRSQLR